MEERNEEGIAEIGVKKEEELFAPPPGMKESKEPEEGKRISNKYNKPNKPNKPRRSRIAILRVKRRTWEEPMESVVLEEDTYTQRKRVKQYDPLDIISEDIADLRITPNGKIGGWKERRIFQRVEDEEEISFLQGQSVHNKQRIGGGGDSEQGELFILSAGAGGKRQGSRGGGRRSPGRRNIFGGPFEENRKLKMLKLSRGKLKADREKILTKRRLQLLDRIEDKGTGTGTYITQIFIILYYILIVY